MPHYVHDDYNNRVLALSKEEFYAVLNAAIQQGQLPSVAEDTAFVTMLKSITDNETYKIAFCTQATYNELENEGELVANCLYIITDDETYANIETAINNLQTNVNNLVSQLGNLSIIVEYMEEDRLLSRTLITSETPTGYQDVSGSLGYVWSIDEPNFTHSEKLYILSGSFKSDAIASRELTFIFDNYKEVGSIIYLSGVVEQYFIETGVGLIKVTASLNWTSSTACQVMIKARKINLTNFSEETISGAEFELKSLKAVANWKD